MVIVIAPETGDEIRAAVGDGSTFGARVSYVEQEAPLGLAHALLTAEEALGGSAFAMYLGDNLLRNGIADLADHFRHDEHDALILLTKVPDPWHYGVAELRGDEVVRLVEKPKDPPSDMALVGVYLFGPAIFDAARSIEPSGRGELEITDAIQHLIDNGSRVESRTVTGWWKDTGQLADMLEANRLVLEDIEHDVQGEVVESKIEGRVTVAAGATIERSVVRGPAIIGSGAAIVDAYVGPYTSIGENVRLERSEVEHSILLAGSAVSDLDSRMEASLLGRNVKLSRGQTVPRTLSMIVGDNSEIVLP
jgi:glucose-1-phosphate thymidylyltransferase